MQTSDYETQDYIGYRPIADVFYVSYGDFYPNYTDEGVWFEAPYSGFSDYSGGTVERANVESWKELLKGDEYEGLWKVALGGHGTESIFLHVDLLEDEAVQKVLAELDDYPIIDEERLSELEVELQEEAWDEWYREEFRYQLRVLGVDEDWLDGMDDEEFDEKWMVVMDEGNHYWSEETGGNMYLDVKRIAVDWVEKWRKDERV